MLKFQAMKRTIFFSLLFLLLNHFVSAQKPPNIIFILADDLGYGDLGCYGQEKIKTPNIDRLASQGMRFTQFYSGSTVCAPARSSFLTGTHTGHTYIRGNKEVIPEGQEPLADSIKTFAMLLQKSGYTTGAFGKWSMGIVGSTGSPEKKGFDQFYGYNCQRQSHRYYPTHLWDNDKKIVLEGNELKEKKVYAPELIQRKTLEFIETNKDKPFFLFIPTVLPHAELQGPDDAFYKMYAGRFDEKPFKGNDYGTGATVAGYASVAKPRATFAAMVSRLDAYVGQILARLEELGLSENTIIFFSSDNGPHREGGADPDFFRSNGGQKGYKRDLYEGGVRVPFIAKWPGKIKTGTTNAFAGAFWDLMPTFLELAGARNQFSGDGFSLLPTLTGTGVQQQHKFLYWEFHENGGAQALRIGNWKAVRTQVFKNPGGPIELYDLATDRSEHTDVAAKHPDIVARAIQFMKEAHVESAIFPFNQKASSQ